MVTYKNKIVEFVDYNLVNPPQYAIVSNKVAWWNPTGISDISKSSHMNISNFGANITQDAGLGTARVLGIKISCSSGNIGNFVTGDGVLITKGTSGTSYIQVAHDTNRIYIRVAAGASNEYSCSFYFPYEIRSASFTFNSMNNDNGDAFIRWRIMAKNSSVIATHNTVFTDASFKTDGNFGTLP